MFSRAQPPQKIDVSLTKEPVNFSTGVKSQISWHSLRDKLPSASLDRYEIVGFTASPEGLLIHWEWKR